MSTTARIPRGKGKKVVSEASFTRGEKKSLFKTMRNLFKMCLSLEHRQVKEINKDKLVRRQ